MEVPTSLLCTPLMYAAESSPARYGSSEKYSKFRPHSGLRLMFTAGPSTTATSSCWQLAPIRSPSLPSSSRSNEAAVAQAAGMQTALMLSLMPK